MQNSIAVAVSFCDLLLGSGSIRLAITGCSSLVLTYAAMTALKTSAWSADSSLLLLLRRSPGASFVVFTSPHVEFGGANSSQQTLTTRRSRSVLGDLVARHTAISGRLLRPRRFVAYLLRMACSAVMDRGGGFCESPCGSRWVVPLYRSNTGVLLHRARAIFL